MAEVKAKKFVVIPRDAFELLTRRYSTLEEATAEAKESCSESGMQMIVVEMKATAARADRPVTVRRL
jgi:hypothetical protein